MANGETHDWPTTGSAADFAAWAKRMLWQVPAGHTDLVMLDYEGELLRHAYGYGTRRQREDAIDVIRTWVNALRTAHPKSITGCYAFPMSEHEWPESRYSWFAYQFGRMGELLNRMEVIFPLLYLLGDKPGHEYHTRHIMEMAMASAQEHGHRVAPCVSPCVWNYDGAGNRPDNDISVNWEVFESQITTIMEFNPSDLVAWTAAPYYHDLKMKREVGRLALTDSEKTEVHRRVAEEVNLTLVIMRKAVGSRADVDDSGRHSLRITAHAG
jgi:hypothetical protein